MPGRAKSVKPFERSNELDTALYKNIQCIFTFFTLCLLKNINCNASVQYSKCNFYLELDEFFDRDAGHDGEKEEHSKFVTTA